MSRFIDLTGQKFGRLTVLRNLGKGKDSRFKFLCKCECGKEVEVKGVYLTTNQVRSCGCLAHDISRENALKRNKGNKFGEKHGKSHTKLYKIWKGVRMRCYSKTCKGYKNYGGRGIKMCEEWKSNFESFYEWAMSNGYFEGKRGECTIERKDVNGDYEPDNCEWRTIQEQQNNKRNSHFITFKGKTQTLTNWAKELGIDRSTLRDRLKVSKWSIEKAFTTPVKKRKKKPCS